MKLILTFLMATVFSLTVFAQSRPGNVGLQVQEYVYDFAVNGGATSTIDLSVKKKIPVGAVVMDVLYKIETAFNSSGSATVAIGDAASTGRYKTATAFDNSAYELNDVALGTGVPVHVTAANIGQIGVTIAGAALTAGKMKLYVFYYIGKQN